MSIAITAIDRAAIRIHATQKLRQKSQAKSCDIPLGASSIIEFRIPILLISKIKKAESRAINIISPKNVNIVIANKIFKKGGIIVAGSPHYRDKLGIIVAGSPHYRLNIIVLLCVGCS